MNMTTEMRRCAEYHREQADQHKAERLMREECNLGPPYPRKYELRHARWARCIEEMVANLKDYRERVKELVK